MPALIALAVSVGVLAVGATWLYFLPALAMANLQVWQGFIAWGCHYHCGGKITGTRNTIICMSWGSVVGMGAALLAAHLPLGTLALPVAVGLGAALIVLSSKVPLLSAIPASVYGFASIAGLMLLGGPGTTPTKALVPTILSIVVGAIFGYVSEVLAGALTRKGAA